MIEKKSFQHQGVTHTTIIEIDDSDNPVCSGCKEAFTEDNDGRTIGFRAGETEIRYYFTHEQCAIYIQTAEDEVAF